MYKLHKSNYILHKVTLWLHFISNWLVDNKTRLPTCGNRNCLDIWSFDIRSI